MLRTLALLGVAAFAGRHLLKSRADTRRAGDIAPPPHDPDSHADGSPRAEEHFRPDIHAPVAPEDRESLRPVTVQPARQPVLS